MFLFLFNTINNFFYKLFNYYRLFLINKYFSFNGINEFISNVNIFDFFYVIYLQLITILKITIYLFLLSTIWDWIIYVWDLIFDSSIWLPYWNSTELFSHQVIKLFVYSPFIAIIHILFLNNETTIKKVGFIYGVVIFLYSLLIVFIYANLNSHFYSIVELDTSIFIQKEWIPLLNLSYDLSLNGFGLIFLVLTAFLTPICILCSWNSINKYWKEFVIIFFIIEFILFHVFLVYDLILFYIAYESIVVPMYFLIGVWGSRRRKIHAGYQFFLYTLSGSLLMLMSLFYIYNECGSTNLDILINYPFSYREQLILWLTFFFAFAVKIPMVPFHIWLPEAHVEAPTSGSILLAGILLKMGGYAMLRFLLPIFPEATLFFNPLVFTLSIISIIYASLATIRQIDLKKIVAYSSVAHMNYVTLGIFSGTLEGINGSVYLMLGHGLISSGLFLCVGIIYDRYKNRIVRYYGGLVTTMPLFSLAFFFFTLANVGFPGTINFIGEFLCLIGIMKVNLLLGILSGLTIILSILYSLWLYNRIFFGKLKTNFLKKFIDVRLNEIFCIIVLAIPILILGITTETVMNIIEYNTAVLYIYL